MSAETWQQLTGSAVTARALAARTSASERDAIAAVLRSVDKPRRGAAPALQDVLAGGGFLSGLKAMLRHTVNGLAVNSVYIVTAKALRLLVRLVRAVPAASTIRLSVVTKALGYTDTDTEFIKAMLETISSGLGDVIEPFSTSLALRLESKVVGDVAARVALSLRRLFESQHSADAREGYPKLAQKDRAIEMRTGSAVRFIAASMFLIVQGVRAMMADGVSMSAAAILATAIITQLCAEFGRMRSLKTFNTLEMLTQASRHIMKIITIWQYGPVEAEDALVDDSDSDGEDFSESFGDEDEESNGGRPTTPDAAY